MTVEFFDGGGRGGEDEEAVESKSRSLLFLIGTLLLAEDGNCRSTTEGLEAAMTAAEEEEADGDDVDELSFFVVVKPRISNPK